MASLSEELHALFLRLREPIPFLGWEYEYERNPGENYFSYRGPDTALNIHTMGLGDEMMVMQFGSAFCDFLAEYGDPQLGTIDFVVGGFGPLLESDPADLHVFWLYSFGPKDENPGEYLEYMEREMNILPDVILCASEQICREAEQAGYSTIYFPIGVYGYRPLGLERRGFGYAGSKNHKGEGQVQELMGGYLSDTRFEWVDDLPSVEQLNLWYNSREFNFGLHRSGQQEWGTVNSRVFESLASSTPLILPSHPNLNDVLGFEYPYQVSNDRDVDRLVERIRSQPSEVRAEFDEYSERVREEHSYLRRIEYLVEQLS